MNILQRIFSDHFEEMIYLRRPRASVIENVDKMINCGIPSFGGAMYICPDCDAFKYVPFRCHSRFCPTCGNMYSIDRTTSMSFKIIDVNHRHCVFTIAKDLRPFFLQDRSLLNCLFSSVNSVVSRMFQKTINPNYSLLALSVFYIPLAETLNGILIFIALFQKAALATLFYGETKNISITIFYVTHSKPLFLMNFILALVNHSKNKDFYLLKS